MKFTERASRELTRETYQALEAIMDHDDDQPDQAANQAETRRVDWSSWTVAERYVAGLLREAGCRDPQPLLGFRPHTSGRLVPRCRLCGTTMAVSAPDLAALGEEER